MEKAPNLGEPEGAAPYAGDSGYKQVVAEAQHGYETSLYGDQETLKDAWANATYQRQLMGLEQPAALKANAARMNPAGLLESGANASARTSALNAAAEKRNSVFNNLSQTEGRITADEAAKKVEGEDKIVAGVNAASGRAAEARMASEAREQNEKSIAASERAAQVSAGTAPGQPGVPYAPKGTGQPSGAPRPGWEWFQQKDGSWSERAKPAPPKSGSVAKAKGKW